jgi:hypothetical protein
MFACTAEPLKNNNNAVFELGTDGYLPLQKLPDYNKN